MLEEYLPDQLIKIVAEYCIIESHQKLFKSIREHYIPPFDNFQNGAVEQNGFHSSCKSNE